MGPLDAPLPFLEELRAARGALVCNAIKLLVLSSVACRGLLEMRHGTGSIRIAFFLKLKLGLVHRPSSKIHELGKTIKRWLKLKTITDYQSVT